MLNRKRIAKTCLVLLLCMASILTGCKENDEASDISTGIKITEAVVDKDASVLDALNESEETTEAEEPVEEAEPEEERIVEPVAEDQSEELSHEYIRGGTFYYNDEYITPIAEEGDDYVSVSFSEEIASSTVCTAAITATDVLKNENVYLNDFRSVKRQLEYPGQFIEWEELDSYFVETCYEYDAEKMVSIYYNIFFPKAENIDRTIYYLTFSYEPLFHVSEYMYNCMAKFATDITGEATYLQDPSIYEAYDNVLDNMKYVYQSNINRDMVLMGGIPHPKVDTIDEEKDLGALSDEELAQTLQSILDRLDKLEESNSNVSYEEPLEEILEETEEDIDTENPEENEEED